MTGRFDLDTYTQADAMRALLQAHLPGFGAGPLRIDALTVRSARRNTSRERNPSPMTVCYELQVADRDTGRQGTQVLSGQVFRPGHSAAAFALHQQGPWVEPAFGEALVHLPQCHLLLWAMPNDPALPQLARLLSAPDASALLPAAAGGAEQGPVQIELLRYTPQQRATLRYTQGPGAAVRTVYAKTFADGRAQDIHARFDHFWRLAQADATAPLVAQPLGCDATTRTLWQAAAQGVPLLQALAQQDGAPLLRSVAHALAQVHRAPLAPGADAEPRTVALGVAEARRRQTKISRACPELAVRAGLVADVIEAHAEHLGGGPLSLIHGDFHPDQIWIHDSRVVLFDFDEFTHGDPMEDIATFVLKLQQTGVAPGLCQHFIDHYAAIEPARFNQRRLDWHLALQSLMQTSRAFVFQQPGWAGAMQRRLAASEAHAAALVRECVA